MAKSKRSTAAKTTQKTTEELFAKAQQQTELAHQRELQKRDTKILHIEALRAHLEEELAEIKRVADWAAEVPAPTPVAIKRVAHKVHGSATAILTLSDWHVEETVDPSTVNNLNKFNLEIASQRIKRTFEKAVILIEAERKMSNIKDMVVAILGDIITGYIHEELMEDNSLSPTEACLFAEDHITGGIEFLLKESGCKSITIPTALGNHGRCHDSQTELLTKAGWKAYTDVNVGDIVATFNMATGKNEWQPLQDMYVDFYTGPMISVKHNSADWLVTPAHRMVLRNYHSEVASFDEMQNLAENTIGCRYFPKYAEGLDADMPGISDDELRVLGWVMTDGSVQPPRQRKLGPAVSIYQSKPDKVEKIEKLLHRLGYKFSHYKRERRLPVILGKQVKTVKLTHQFYLHAVASQHVANLMPDKTKIPDWFHNLSQRQVHVWLEAVVDGDGALGKGKHCEIHGTRAFLDQVQALLLVNGASTRVRINCRGDAVLNVRATKRGYINDWAESVKTIDYKGAIWCGTVANGTLITRRNGIPLISGNTTAKLRIGTHHKNSFEWLMYRHLEKCYRNDPRVTWKVENSYHNWLTVQGKDIRFHHGTPIKYKGGVAGPSVPIRRKIAQWNSAKVAWWDIFGHLHIYEPGDRYLVNPSLIGYGAFSEFVGGYTPPMQTLMVVDKNWSIPVSIKPIFCEAEDIHHGG